MDMKAVLAELIGTFTLVFVGTATAVFAGSGILARSNYETGEIASAMRGLTDQQ
jgi:glycerol uptake facilitator-like aquaporin